MRGTTDVPSVGPINRRRWIGPADGTCLGVKGLIPPRDEAVMDQFVYVADPGNQLRMRNSTYLEQVRITGWRLTHRVEEPDRLDEELRRLLLRAGAER
jgi:hypothetical protein